MNKKQKCFLEMGWWDTMELLLVGATHLGRIKNKVNCDKIQAKHKAAQIVNSG